MKWRNGFGLRINILVSPPYINYGWIINFVWQSKLEKYCLSGFWSTNMGMKPMLILQLRYYDMPGALCDYNTLSTSFSFFFKNKFICSFDSSQFDWWEQGVLGRWIYSLLLQYFSFTTGVIYCRHWWLNSSDFRRAVIPLASSSWVDLWSCCSSCCSRPKGIQILRFNMNAIRLLLLCILIKFPFPNPTRDCHLCSDEISWRMPIYGWSTKCGCILGASTLLW